MTYNDLVTALATMLAESPTDPDFVAILPRCIEYAEQRIYRELDLAAASTRLYGASLGSAATLTANNRNLVLPAGTLVVLEGMALITPAGTTNPEAGSRKRLTLVSWDVLDMLYGDASVTALPSFYALQDANTIAVGPWPDQAYGVELLGSIRPPALSSGNTSTILSLYLPDLFFAACMVFMSAYTKNFGSQSDNPQMAMSWEGTFNSLKASAETEEARKRISSGGMAS